MKLIRTVMLLSLASILLYACSNRGEHPYITFVNKSNEKIACQELWWAGITKSDTLFSCGLGAVRIEPDSLIAFACMDEQWGRGWEDNFSTIPFIQYLIMDQETYWQYSLEPCDTIRKYVPVLHVYQLTLEDLERMNWTVVYPPEEENL